MSDNKRNHRSNGRGYYIALILCAAAIGISGYLYNRNENKTQEVSLAEPSGETVSAELETAEDVAVVATQPADAATATTQATVPETTEKKAMKTMSPVEGDVISGYSMEALSYNQTTRDWRVHNGLDIAAEAGTPVCAAADGEVYSVSEDDALGYTVVIRHEGGYTTKYSSLSEALSVQAGDMVTMGQTIGYVGDSALVESSLGSHVHFSVTCQGAEMDPKEFLTMGE